jgi:hypothetical protein
MQAEHLGILRAQIEAAKPRPFDPDVRPKQPLAHGWLLQFLLEADRFTWGRWEHWFEMMQVGKAVGEGIPQIEWTHSPAARKMLENALNSITRYGGWQGWSSWQYINYFFEWMLFGLGHDGHKTPPKEPAGSEGASDRLFQTFNLETLLAFPSDYFGDILADNQFGKQSGFFPTPMNIVEMMVRMVIDGDAREKTVCDPCVGTGRMLLAASNYSYRLYGVDIDGTVIKATLINGYLYAPWLVKPFPFLDRPNLDPAQDIKISNVLARQQPDYYKDTVPDTNGHEFAPIKKRKKIENSLENAASDIFGS